MIKRPLLKYRTDKANRQKLDIRTSIKYRDSKNIGLIFTIEDIQKHHAIKKFIEDLKMDGKEVTSIAYLPAGKDNYEFLFDFFTSKEISVFGQLENDKAINFMNQHFDFLFNLDKKTNIYTRYIVANSNAKCRAGNFNVEEDDFFEFMIKPLNTDFTSLYSDLTRYIKKI